MRYLLIFIILPFSASAQFFDTIAVEKKLKFIHALSEKRQFGDACYLLHHINEKEQIDSLLLLEARLLLDLRKEREAEALLDKYKGRFQADDEKRCRSVLMRNHSRLMSGRYDSLMDPSCGHIRHREEWRLQLMAQSLFRNRTDDFELVFNSDKCNDPILSVVEFALYVQKQDILRTPQKSRFLAGLFSALIPGTGKWYAGKPREALYAFMPVAFNAAQAGEGYYFDKWKSPHLYFFGGLATLFYTSNIYGSANAAKRKNEENEFRIKSNIEFEISKLTKYY